MSTEDAGPTPEAHTSYDDLPYDGRPIGLTHPERLALEALRRGLSPAPPDRCRVLELGCAEASNTVALAFYLDQCRFVGVDASRVQIERGVEARDRLGLDNLELRCADILSLGEELGTFDYILCHGVFSWVSDEVRRKILAICRAHLAPQGVAYLSYNCMPGWALRGELRRAMLTSTRGVSDPRERAEKLSELLSMLVSSPLRETRQGALLAEEAARILDHRVPYVMHEYLEHENRAFHFREIVGLAREHDLAFAGELTRASLKSLEDAVSASVRERFSDPLEAEEIADLLLYRTFRASLFVRREALEQAREPEAARRELAARARFAAPVVPETPRPSLEPEVQETFRTADGVRVAARYPALKAALLELGLAWPSPLSLDELIDRVTAVLRLRRVLPLEGELDASTREQLHGDLLELDAGGIVELRLLAPRVARRPPERPLVHALTRLEASRAAWATSPFHHVVELDTFARFLVRYLDGSRDRAELAAAMRAHVDSGEIVVSDGDGEPVAPERLDEGLVTLVDAVLEALAARGLVRA